MTPSMRWLFGAATTAIGGSGAVYAVMAYGMEPEDPMDLFNHPWQPAVQHWHVWSAPVWVFGFGMIWSGHVLPRWRSGNRTRRRSGITLIALAVVMVASGYLLQTAVDDAWRAFWVEMHFVSSLAWMAVLGLHLFGGSGRRGTPPGGFTDRFARRSSTENDETIPP